MIIEIKKIKFYERMSKETNAFSADLYINGKKVGYCRNEGNGGSTDYLSTSAENRLLVEEAEKYCLGLPPIKYGNMEIPMALEGKIDLLFDEWLRGEEAKKMEKKLSKSMLSALCIKTDKGYSEITWKLGKRKVTINELLSTPNGKVTLCNAIKRFKSEGKEILNTNIPKELI